MIDLNERFLRKEIFYNVKKERQKSFRIQFSWLLQGSLLKLYLNLDVNMFFGVQSKDQIVHQWDSRQE